MLFEKYILISLTQQILCSLYVCVRSKDDVQIRGISGGTINDVTTALKIHPTNDTSTVTLVIGSNDCDSPSTTTEILSDFKSVVDEAKRVATDTVVITSILPRMTTKIYQRKADTINSHLAKLSNDLNCIFIDDDSNMRFANGSLDECIFTDKIHLNHSGTERLIQNLQLHGLIRPKGECLKSPSSKSAKIYSASKKNVLPNLTHMTDLRAACTVASPAM